MSRGLMHERAFVWGEDGTRFITHQLDTTFDVKRIVETMGKLMRSKGDEFSVHHAYGRDWVEKTQLGELILLCIKSDFRAIDEQFPRHRQSPLFTIFKRFFKPFGYTGGRPWPELVPFLNAAVVKARAFSKGPAVGERLKNLKRCERENAGACSELLTELHRRYSKLLTVRVDFGYYSSHCPGVGFRGQVMTLEQIKAHRNKLLAHIRKGPGAKHLAGYMWKLEYGLEKGYHLHFALFYDGQKASQDIVRGDALGKFWKEKVTDGKGMFFNCNKKKADYERCGIGMAARSDREKWAALKDAMRYLTKVDLYLRFLTDGRSRTFGIGGPYGGIGPTQPLVATIGRSLANAPRANQGAGAPA